jgi:hypothetical protein
MEFSKQWKDNGSWGSGMENNEVRGWCPKVSQDLCPGMQLVL